ncbi:MAG: PAS domain-containing sensor histidine kinase, partial [Herminiimonas sp.]|nr:PAS domain-containing sensor histidine kinase [Herminiimonas sp.]
SEARFRSVLRAVSAIVWVTPPSGAFETEQAEWAAFTGQSFDEIKGSGWLDAVHPEDRARTIGAARTARHDCAPFQLQQRLRRADGQYRHMSVQVVPVMNADGTLREWVGAHSDVTDQKNAEELLRQSAKNLAEADRRKSEFISTLAHELRNPLAPIRSGLQVMQMAADKPETVARVRAVMERQVAHMVHLIDDLLDIGRISHGQIELRRKAVDLRDIVASAVETSMPLIDASRHALTLALDDEPFSLFADPVRIAQVLSNLLNNAAKYTPAGGLIRLSAQRQEREVVITVTDSGIGIPQESLALVFDMFMQLGQRHERAQGGLGIGLSLVRTLVEMHDGVVSATSEGGGRGASFSVRLPLAEA